MCIMYVQCVICFEHLIVKLSIVTMHDAHTVCSIFQGPEISASEWGKIEQPFTFTHNK